MILERLTKREFSRELYKLNVRNLNFFPRVPKIDLPKEANTYSWWIESFEYSSKDNQLTLEGYLCIELAVNSTIIKKIKLPFEYKEKIS